MNSQSNTTAFYFAALAIASAAMSQFAPTRPDRFFISIVLAIVAATLAVLFFAKKKEERPINWLTVDILFAATYCIVHFGYFVYWVLGFFRGQTPLWNFNFARAADTVNYSLAMYATCLNVFLAGFYLIRTRRGRPILNAACLSTKVSLEWERLSRMLMLAGFAGFAGYVAIVGPEVVFGSYSGTNNKGFAANILFHIGQNYLIAGTAVAVASGNQLGVQKRGRKLLGFGVFNLFIMGTIAIAIGLHGDRSTLMWIVLGAMVAYSEYRSPLKARTLAVSAIIILFLLGFIVAFRSNRSSSQDLGFANTLNRAAVNFGSSAVCGFVAVDYTEKHGLFKGKFQLLPLAGVLPFGRKIFKMVEDETTCSSTLLTKLINGRVKGVAGTGTSIFADFYFDFGFAGTAFCFLLTGLGCKWAQNAARDSTSILWSVGYVSLVVYMSIVSRYSLLGGILRLVIYSVIFTAIAAFLLGISTRFQLSTARSFEPPISGINRIRRSVPGQ